eukprot:COSAG01_NODE_7886_length_3007_cov_1.991747_3_plen_104_part_00
MAGRGTVFDVGRARTAQAGRALLRTHCPVDEGQAQLGVAMLPVGWRARAVIESSCLGGRTHSELVAANDVAMLPVGWRARAVTANLAGRAVPCSPAPANRTHD